MITTEVHDAWLDKFGIRLLLKRLDLLPSGVSGNKYFKLKYNLLEAKEQRHTTLLTLGGAFSNHILATAEAGEINGFKTIGIIRGEENFPLNPVLQKAKSRGMEIHYVSREKYRQKEEEFFISDLHQQFGDFFFLPEGGSNRNAVKGCMEILDEEDFEAGHIVCCCGTGATLAGIILSMKHHQCALGISVLKGEGYIENKVKRFLDSFPKQQSKSWIIRDDFHFGGYAKSNPELANFCHQFSERSKIPVEPVYTGKMFWAIYHLSEIDFLKRGSTLLAIHSGGVLDSNNNS